MRVKRNGKTRTANCEVIPLKNLRERCFLVLFEEADKARRTRAAARAPVDVARAARLDRTQEPSRIAELETELAETREFTQAMQEQHEAANEELQAANEEVQSANEELQSINEELETSKEELESANEELTTVNEEMSNRNIELNRLNNDLVNFQNLGQARHRAARARPDHPPVQPAGGEAVRPLRTDVGRPVGHIRQGFVEVGQAVPSPANRRTRTSAARNRRSTSRASVAEVIAEVREQEREVRDKSGRWYSLRVRPYMTLDNKVDGAVLVLRGHRRGQARRASRRRRTRLRREHGRQRARAAAGAR